MIKRRAPVFALLSAVLFGMSTPLSKALLADMTPWLLAGLLYLGAGAGLLLYRWGSIRVRGHSTETSLDGNAMLWLAGSTFFGGVLGPVLLMIGLARTPAALATLLLTLEGVFTALLAWFVFKEHFDRRIAVGMAAITAGAIVLAWNGQPCWDAFLGPLAVAGACLSWGIDNNLTRKIASNDPVQIASVKGLAAGLVNLSIALLAGASLPTLSQVVGASLVGFMGYGLSIVFFVLSLRHIGTSRTSAYFSTAPFIGALLAVLVLGESVTWGLLSGGALMAFGIWMHLTERHEHEHVHPPVEHAHRHTHDEHHRHDHAPGDPQGEPHSHPHAHDLLRHAHLHFPDASHRHRH